jgi:RNA polymerase sigma-70 factor, ECF subfamily
MHAGSKDPQFGSDNRKSPDIRAVGNIGLHTPVSRDADSACRADGETTELEKATTVTLTPALNAPAHMSHVPLAEAEVDWVDASDELTGTGCSTPPAT